MARRSEASPGLCIKVASAGKKAYAPRPTLTVNPRRVCAHATSSIRASVHPDPALITVGHNDRGKIVRIKLYATREFLLRTPTGQPGTLQTLHICPLFA